MHMTRGSGEPLSAAGAGDRARPRGFGGGLFSTGIISLPRGTRGDQSLVQIVAIMGLAGFGAAIGVHPAIGYRHGPPGAGYLGFLMFVGTVGRLAQNAPAAEYSAHR